MRSDEAETDGAGGQFGKHRTRFSAAPSTGLGKQAGVSVIDASVNKAVDLRVCVVLMS